MDENLIFSLDIGTRTIIGIVGEYTEDERFKVQAYSIKEHKKRNMYDGQIHDIEGVARTVGEIIKDLESKIGRKLKVVSIAAAGRALKTHRVMMEKEMDPAREISLEDVEALEIEAVQKAQEEINTDQGNLKYYSIGYTVVDYYLNEDRMDKLQGHKGERMGLELLATFLPQVVIESLYSVISKVGLEVGSITLEPIAAINIAIKEELRLLNLALVDIGAGTSDIAITKEGQIISYAMTSTAGDEITERLAKAYLLDFNSSEKLKVELSERDEHEFTDVVGIGYKISTKEIISNIQDIIDKISMEIAEKIIEYNGKAPNAVFLVGGSSQMPGLKETIADKLGLPRERVAIRDISFLDNIDGLKDQGPNMITPLGIAIEGAKDKYRNFIKVNFNGEEVRIFNTDNIKVSDVLILTGFNPRDLLPKRSIDFTYYVNGRKRKIKGRDGSIPQILVDGLEGSLKTKLHNGAKIEIIPSQLGDREEPFLYDVIFKDKYIYYNGEKIDLVKAIKVNGDLMDTNIKLIPDSYIEIEEIKSLNDFLLEYGGKANNYLVNNKSVGSDYELQIGDIISQSTVSPLENKINTGKKIKLVINNEEMEIQYKKDKFIFVDIFDHIDFDLTALRGRLVLQINNRDAEYLEELSDGDEIKVYWA